MASAVPGWLARLGVLLLIGCAPGPDSPSAIATLVIPHASEGVVRDHLETSARREDFRPPEWDADEVRDVIPENQMVFVQRIDRRDFPLYKNQYANQVPFDPEWKITFDFEPQGRDSLRVVGRAWIRTREPPAGDWSEHQVTQGHVIESLREIVEEVEMLLQ